MKSMEAFKGRIRILIVDDEKSILQLYVNMLHPGHLSGSVDFEPPSYSPPANSNGNNLDVTLCSTYREAVTTIEQSRTDPFSLAFLDVHLGRDDDNGIDLAGKIRQIDKEIEIVLVTGDSNIDMFRISREIPPKDKLFYLNKPFKTLEIRQFVESLSAKWRTEKELHEMKDNLADLVDERTRELSESNSKLRTEIEAKQRIAESLRVSEDNFKRMIEENADPIIIVDARGRVQYVNPATEQLFQTGKDEILESDFQFPLETGDRSEISFQNKAGADLTCEMRVAMTEWHGNKAYLATLRDITERKHLEEQLWNSLERNQIVMRGTIQVIARFLEMKDPYTAGHQKRVSELAISIASSLGLNDHEQEGIHMAAMIHDIGKISIPSEILSKPGKLSDIEYDLIKTHPQTGFDILKEIEFPWPVARIVLQHHEKLDGSGYPDGIRGDAILFLSRILTVADVMEAISSHRPYRAALGIEKGIDHLRKHAGKLYDPAIVEACVSLFSEHHFQFKTQGLQAREYSDPPPVERTG